MWSFVGTSGQYSFFNRATCPPGWIAADGANGTVDLRGEFIRGLDSGRGVDAGRVLGSEQAGSRATGEHPGGWSPQTLETGQMNLDPNYYGPARIIHAETTTAGYYTGSTYIGVVRPRNKALLACVKS